MSTKEYIRGREWRHQGTRCISTCPLFGNQLHCAIFNNCFPCSANGLRSRGWNLILDALEESKASCGNYESSHHGLTLLNSLQSTKGLLSGSLKKLELHRVILMHCLELFQHYIHNFRSNSWLEALISTMSTPSQFSALGILPR